MGLSLQIVRAVIQKLGILLHAPLETASVSLAIPRRWWNCELECPPSLTGNSGIGSRSRA